MKKVVLGLVSICLFVALVGCSSDRGNQASGNSNEKVGTDKRVEIKLWLDDDKYAKALVPKIEEALPHIKIKYEYLNSGESAGKLELDGPAGIGADVVFHTIESMAKTFKSNTLLPLGDDLTNYVNENMLPGSIHSVLNEGKMYGVPMSVESLALYYNKTLLDESGLSLATSFEQLIEESKAYNDFNSNKFLLRFEAWSTYTSYFFLTAAGFELFGPDGNDVSQVNLNTPEVVEGLTMLKEVQQMIPIPSKELNWDTTHGEFVKGTVPYVIGGPWALREIKEAAETLGFEFGVTTLPTIKGVLPQPFLGNIIATISAYTKYPQEAREVLTYISSPEGMQIMHDATGKLPALTDLSVIEGVTKNPYLMGFNEQIKQAKPMPMMGELENFYEAANVMFQSVWDGITTPEAAAQKAEKDFNTIVEVSK